MPPEIRLSLQLDASAATPAQIIDAARTAERGVFDAVIASPPPYSSFEPSTVLGLLAAATSRIGLVASVSPLYAAPYNQARYISTLDHLSKGRAGWAIAPSAQDSAASLHGLPETPSEDERYDRAAELLTVLEALWHSWDDDAVVADKESGLFVRRDSIHDTDHRGERFAVAGPFNLPRSPQVVSPLYAYVTSERSALFAAERADVAIVADVARAAELREIERRSERAVPLVVLLERVVAPTEVAALAAALLEEAEEVAVDGFVLQTFADTIGSIVDRVIPELVDSGRYRTDYQDETLRARVARGIGAAL